MSVARKILENTFVQVLGKIITAGLSVVVLKIISGYLGTAGYGDYTTVYQYLAFFGIIADFGIYTITVKEMSRDETKIPWILGNVMGLRTFLTLVAMGLGLLTVFLIPVYRGTLVPIGVAIATITTLLTLLNGTIATVLQVHLKMHYTTLSLVAGKIVSVAYMAWAVFVAFPSDLTTGFYHLLWAGVIGNLVMMLLTWHYTRRYAPVTIRFDFDFWSRIFKQSLPYGAALVLNNIYFRVDVLLLSFMLPHSSTLPTGASCVTTLCGDTEVGLYGVAQRLLELLIIIPVYFMNAVLPIMTRYVEEKSERVRQLMQYSFDFLIASAVPLLVGGFILAVPIIHLISDAPFVGGHTYAFGSDLAVRILMFAMAFSFVNSLFGFTLVVLNQQIKLMYINAGAVFFNVVANLLVIQTFGFRGAAFTSVLSELIILVLAYRVTRKALNFSLKVATLLKVVFSALVMGVLLRTGLTMMTDVWFVWQFSLLLPLGILIYLGMIWLTKAVTPEMLALLRKRP